MRILSVMARFKQINEGGAKVECPLSSASHNLLKDDEEHALE
jgi:hypothetical protein